METGMSLKDYLLKVREFHLTLGDSTELLNELITAINNHRSVFLIGNGGSASTCEHFATDLNFIKNGNNFPKFNVEALSANTSVLTALANDIGYAEIFAHQLKRSAQSDDLLLVVSASGNSENLIRAVEEATKIGMRTVALLGFDGGVLSKMVAKHLLVRTPQGEYGPVEDVHLSICHYFSYELRTILNGKYHS